MTDSDPRASIVVGDHPGDWPRYNHEVEGFFHPGSLPDLRTTRAAYGISVHAARRSPFGEWQHIASRRSADGGVQEVWMEEPMLDPHASIAVGTDLASMPYWDDPVTGVFIRAGISNWCREPTPSGSGSACSRATGHPAHWRHVAATSRSVLEVWGGGVPPILDPEDGTAEDTVVTTTPPSVGQVMRLRNRRNRLYVMKVRTSGDVEALDFTRDELRVLPLDRCIALTEDAMLTMDEISQVGRWYHAHRKAVKNVAVREYRNDRWCLSGLNGELRTLGLEPYEPSLHGVLVLTVPFDCPNIHAVSSEVEGEVRDAVQAQEAALRAAMPSVKGIELVVSELKVRATELTRK